MHGSLSIWQSKLPYDSVNDTHPALERSSLAMGHCVGLSDDWNDIHPWAEPAHELDVELSQAVSGRCDEIE